MKLSSRDGGYLDLRPTGYQFVKDAEDDDDWLVIGAQVRTDDHREWRFTDPCLIVAEAEELAAWFDQVALGRVAAIALDQPEDRLCFIEPNLAFSVAAISAARVDLRVHFSYESLPPWHPHREWPDHQSFTITLDVGKADIQAAAAQWRSEIAPFPERP